MSFQKNGQKWDGQKWDKASVLHYAHDALHVSRETCEKLELYVALLQKWQKAINLVSGKTLDDVWERHILDSLQLVSHLPKEPMTILDCGSGAGLPAVILAMTTSHQIEMVESDTRKCAFMQTALLETQTQAVIHNERLETLSYRNADIITARAFAPLDRLSDWTLPQHKEGQIFWLLKGRGVNEELTLLANSQKVESTLYPSLASGDGVILQMKRMA